ncbi:MAG: hypothetical protein K2Q12_10460 [Rickettsiales bacterium]|nr:hypothetical protein [Rickettsiales bacterium]
MNDWKTQSYSSNSTPVEITEQLLEESVVILMQGKNVYGDPIYAYVQLSLRNLYGMKQAVQKGDNFMPSDFGSVLAAGTGEPSAELRSEMAVTYNMYDVPKPAAPKIELPKAPSWDD